MRLVLFRHARAEDPLPGMTDHERRLTTKGHAQAASTAPQIAALGWTPDLVICSDARRTRETLDIARGSFPGAIIKLDPRIYEDGPIAALLEIGDDVGTAMVIGHNPNLEGLVTRLSHQIPGLGTADAALLELDGTVPWRDALHHAWRLVRVIHPQ